MSFVIEGAKRVMALLFMSKYGWQKSDDLVCRVKTVGFHSNIYLFSVPQKQAFGDFIMPQVLFQHLKITCCHLCTAPVLNVMNYSVG